ncbi:MAG: C-terminal helicase domain-containing protein [Capsulimonadaceae bacterium]|nr:C-terminal helicase domain-containing protein [Capsulimonadaceae bacterium]
MGERIVERTFLPVTVPFGTRQREQYERWLNGFTSWYAASHTELSADAVDKQSAVLGQLVKLEYATTLPCADPDAEHWKVGVSDWTPKMLKVLEIAAEHAVSGEQVLVGSDLMRTGRFIAESLRGKGVRAAHILDDSGQTLSPADRAARIREFTGGETAVLCASVQSIALGHNLDCASVVVLAGLPWDFATLDQFLARVHRLTSRRPVKVYVVLTEGSLDERKWKLLQDKTASAELAIDGHLLEKKQKPISQQEILNELKHKGLPVAETVLESDIRASWEAIRFGTEQTIERNGVGISDSRVNDNGHRNANGQTGSFRLVVDSVAVPASRVRQLSLVFEAERVGV